MYPACRDAAWDGRIQKFGIFQEITCHLSALMLLYISVAGYAGVSEWQTRQTQNLLWATTYGFKSHRRHYRNRQKANKIMVLTIFYFMMLITLYNMQVT